MSKCPTFNRQTIRYVYNGLLPPKDFYETVKQALRLRGSSLLASFLSFLILNCITTKLCFESFTCPDRLIS